MIPSFYERHLESSDSDTPRKILQLIQGNKAVLQAQMAFIEFSCKELYKNIQVFFFLQHMLLLIPMHLRSCRKRAVAFWTPLA